MKKIAVTQRLVKNEPYFEIRETLDINYCKLVYACGFLPIVLPFEVDFIKYFKNIGIDGVLLTGGNDLYSCNENELSKKRDSFENEVLKHCIVHDIPIFGICRGMQLVAEYFGSTFCRINGHVNKRMKIYSTLDSKYKHLLDDIKEVNSYHNYSIDMLSSDFIISAKTNDGLIKAIEHKKYKIFAQMWHSEREKKLDIAQIKLIKEIYGAN